MFWVSYGQLPQQNLRTDFQSQVKFLCNQNLLQLHLRLHSWRTSYAAAARRQFQGLMLVSSREEKIEFSIYEGYSICCLQMKIRNYLPEEFIKVASSTFSGFLMLPHTCCLKVVETRIRTFSSHNKVSGR